MIERGQLPGLHPLFKVDEGLPVQTQVRSGQVRSECLACTFRARWCSARLSRAGQERGGGGGDEGDACTGVYKRIQIVRPRSVTGGGCYGGMKFGMSRGFNPKRKCARISMKEIGRNLDGPPKRENKRAT